MSANLAMQAWFGWSLVYALLALLALEFAHVVIKVILWFVIPLITFIVSLGFLVSNAFFAWWPVGEAINVLWPMFFSLALLMVGAAGEGEIA